MPTGAASLPIKTGRSKLHTMRSCSSRSLRARWSLRHIPRRFPTRPQTGAVPHMAIRTTWPQSFQRNSGPKSREAFNPCLYQCDAIERGKRFGKTTPCAARQAYRPSTVTGNTNRRNTAAGIGSMLYWRTARWARIRMAATSPPPSSATAWARTAEHKKSGLCDYPIARICDADHMRYRTVLKP